MLWPVSNVTNLVTIKVNDFTRSTHTNYFVEINLILNLTRFYDNLRIMSLTGLDDH